MRIRGSAHVPHTALAYGDAALDFVRELLVSSLDLSSEEAEAFLIDLALKRCKPSELSKKLEAVDLGEVFHVIGFGGDLLLIPKQPGRESELLIFEKAGLKWLFTGTRAEFSKDGCRLYPKTYFPGFLRRCLCG